MQDRIDKAMTEVLSVHHKAIGKVRKLLADASPIELQKFCSSVLSLSNAIGHLARARLAVVSASPPPPQDVAAAQARMDAAVQNMLKYKSEWDDDDVDEEPDENE